MIYETNFKINEHKEGIIRLESSGFPFVCMHSDLTKAIWRKFPWHWHNALEIDYAYEGDVRIETTNGVIVLKQGEAAFINTTVPHRSFALTEVCHMYSFFFEVSLINGRYESIFETKYTRPVLNSALQYLHFTGEDEKDAEVLECIDRLFALCREEPEMYEFDVRNELTLIWKNIYNKAAWLRPTASRSVIDKERIKIMMNFIQKNYRKKLTLEDIAASASISTRECTRCFARSLKLSPIGYLTLFRVRTASHRLLETDISIIEISEECGFSSPSYFSKVFKDYFGCTPNQYRAGAGNVELKVN